MSNWLHDTMSPGVRIEADGPFGVFTIARHPSARYLFLSGGSGITPVMSMTRTLYDLGSDADVVFVHSARTPSDIVFRRELPDPRTGRTMVDLESLRQLIDMMEVLREKTAGNLASEDAQLLTEVLGDLKVSFLQLQQAALAQQAQGAASRAGRKP